MNKGELIAKVSGRLGDQQASTIAVDALVTEIENAVSAGDKVNISGFGTFERRDRAARAARNPRTGEPIQVKQTAVPAFRPGQTFKTLVAGGGEGGRRGSAGRAESKPSSRQQPARTQSSRSAQAKAAQPAKAQSSRAQPARGQASRSQTARAQTSRTQRGSVQSSYAGRGQSSYARQGSTTQRQSAKARAK